MPVPVFYHDVVPANFDPSLPPDAEVNLRAAEARGVWFDPIAKAYRSEADGEMLYAEDGSPL
jgi:hypothetical protein